MNRHRGTKEKYNHFLAYEKWGKKEPNILEQVKGEVKTEPELHLLSSRDGGEQHCAGCSQLGACLWG